VVVSDACVLLVLNDKETWHSDISGICCPCSVSEWRAATKFHANTPPRTSCPRAPGRQAVGKRLAVGTHLRQYLGHIAPADMLLKGSW